MRQNTTINFDFDLEDSALYLGCAIKNLRIVWNEISRDLVAIREVTFFRGTGHIEECCDAMFTTLRELDRIQEEMDAAIEAVYAKGD